MKRKYNYFYKITNNINNHFYYGVHCTDNLDDGYMGSGTRLKYAYKKYGIENFSKEILKYFNTINEAYQYESEIVTEDLVHDPECYNIQCGGKGWNTYGSVPVKDKDGNYFRCSKNDPKYMSGEYTPSTKGLIPVKIKSTGEHLMIKKEEYNKEIYEALTKNKITVKDKNGNYYSVSVDDPRYISGEYIALGKNKVSVKDKNGNYYSVSVDDPRYLSGELKCIWTGRKHKPESIKKQKETYKLINHGKGKNNSQYGTCWIYKFDENNKPINIKIKKEELNDYINNGWIKGRKMK